MSLTLAQLGTIHEFGTKHIPARPFLIPALQENRAELQAMSGNLLQRVLQGKMSKRDALGKLGAHGQAVVQEKIRAIWTPPLAESTIRRKGSSKPLIDTGQMVQNVGWEYE